jgi:hypothetical protein
VPARQAAYESKVAGHNPRADYRREQCALRLWL